MKEEDKTKDQLLKELAQLRQRVAELESAVAQHQRDEEVLRHRERYFQSLIENSWDCVAVLDGNGTIGYESPSAERLLGYKAEEMVGRNMLEFVHPEERQSVVSVYRSLVESPVGVVSTSLRYRRKDGSWCVLEGVSRNLLHDPEVNGIISNYRDVTERKRMEEALRESEQKHSALVEQAKDGVYIVQDEVLKFANRALGEINGYSLEEMQDMPFLQVAAEDSKGLVAKRYRQRMSGAPTPSGYEIKIQCKDGTMKDVEVSAGIIQYQGRPADMGIVRDITERKRMDEALRESERLYRLLADNVTDTIWTTDMELHLTYVSPSIERLRGYTVHEVLGQSLGQMMAPVSMERGLDVFRRQQAVETEMPGTKARSWTTEIEVPCRNGSSVWIEATASFMRDANGRPIGLIGVGRNIDDRRRVEQKLRESEETMRSLIENSLDLLAIVDRDGTIRFMNRTVPGLTVEGVVGRTVFDFSQPEYHDVLKASIMQAFQTGQADRLESSGVGPHGSVARYETRFGTVKRHGQVVAVMLIITDITERKLAEEARIERAAALARAEELQRSRQRIVMVQESLRRDISQELHGSVQNGLIVLLHRLTELERAASPGDLADGLRDLRQKLSDMLDSHIRPIGHRLYPSILRQGLIPALQSMGDRLEKTVAVEMELDEDLVSQEKANRRLIPEQVKLAAYRIAEEALTNAIKHGKSSRVTIELSRSAEGSLRLAVRDNGRGFDPAKASSGMGILMMQDYAETVGGKCLIHSGAEQDTEVTAIFPLAGFDIRPVERA